MAKKRKSRKNTDGSPNRPWYTEKIEDIAKKFAKERDNYICQRSGESVEGCNAHGSHVIPKSTGLTLRWDLQNIKCLSMHNHLHWWHKNPFEAAEWFIDKFPDRWEYLEEFRYQKLEIRTLYMVEFYEAALKCKTWTEYRDLYEEEIKPFICER